MQNREGRRPEAADPSVLVQFEQLVELFVECRLAAHINKFDQI